MAKGDVPMKISWLFNAKPIFAHSGIVTTKIGDRSSFLTVPSVTADNRGNYTCIATNAAGTFNLSAVLYVHGSIQYFFKIVFFNFCGHYLFMNSFPVPYTLTVPPQIMPFLFGDEPTNYGESTAVQCMVSKGDLPLTIQWSLNGEPLTSESERITVVKMSPRLSSLSIESINHRHRGIYKCKASNKAGATEYTANLIVNGRFSS